jgi:hypothetical protein
MGGIAVPRFQREQLSEFFVNELAREGDARIEAAIVSNLKRDARFVNAPAQFLAFLDVHAERLFDEHVFAGLNCLHRERDMKLIRDPDDHGFDERVREHLVVILVSDARFVNRGHLLAQVIRQIANGIKLSIARFAASIEVCDLGNRSAAENADAEEARLFFSSRRWISNAQPRDTGEFICIARPKFRATVQRGRSNDEIVRTNERSALGQILPKYAHDVWRRKRHKESLAPVR